MEVNYFEDCFFLVSFDFDKVFNCYIMNFIIGVINGIFFFVVVIGNFVVFFIIF